MHAREATALARMDGTALKAYFALIGAGPKGLSSEECAAAVEYGIRHVQIALKTLVEAGRAELIREGRLIRYVAIVLPSLQSTGKPQPENTGRDASARPAKVMPINVMLNTMPSAFALAPAGPAMASTHPSEHAVRGQRQDWASRET